MSLRFLFGSPYPVESDRHASCLCCVVLACLWFVGAKGVLKEIIGQIARPVNVRR